MNLPYFLSKKIIRGSLNKDTSARPAVRLAILGILLGITAMICSITVVTGFKNEITNKVTGFMAPLRICGFDNNNSFEENPISINTVPISKINKIKGITHTQIYAYKAGIIKTKSEIQGTVLKGVGNDFNWDFFKSKIISGRIPNFNNQTQEVLISKSLAAKLKININDEFLLFFIQKDKKVRKVKISGIYNTGLSEEFDNLYLLCDIKLIQKINNWNDDQVGGVEVFIDDLNNLPSLSNKLYQATGFKLNTVTIKELYPQIFNWLELQNLNVIVIISLITLVAGITMISTLFIIVMESSKQIAVLKSLGANENVISKTFLYIAIYILFRGMVLGNILGIGITFLQSKYHIIKLSEADYYVSSVPVNLTFNGLAFINLTTFLLCIVMMLIPSKSISAIDPVKVLKAE